jgi:hypothetical protein
MFDKSSVLIVLICTIIASCTSIVYPLEPKPTRGGRNNLVLGDLSGFPLELKPDVGDRKNLVLGDYNYLAPVVPLELKPELGDCISIIPLELKLDVVVSQELSSRGLSKAKGWLESYTKTKKLSNGTVATYPRVEGDRKESDPNHWYWAYRYEEKRSNARSDNGYVTRAIACPKTKVEAVRLAQSQGWSIEKIAKFIKE